MDEQRIGFYLLDVSGHGVPAAMLSVSLSMMLTPDAAHGSPLKRYDRSTGQSDVLSPRDAVRELNRRFQPKDDRYFTMLYGVLDTRSSILQMAQAGHPGPILIRKEGDLETLGSGGMPVGIMRDIEFDSFETYVRPGDRLLLYSDGVTECTNMQDEAFGEIRLLSYLKQRTVETIDELLEGLLRAIRTWRGSTEFGDDVSLLAIEIGHME